MEPSVLKARKAIEAMFPGCAVDVGCSSYGEATYKPVDGYQIFWSTKVTKPGEPCGCGRGNRNEEVASVVQEYSYEAMIAALEAQRVYPSNREYIGISDEGMCDYLKIKEEG